MLSLAALIPCSGQHLTQNTACFIPTTARVYSENWEGASCMPLPRFFLPKSASGTQSEMMYYSFVHSTHQPIGQRISTCSEHLVSFTGAFKRWYRPTTNVQHTISQKFLKVVDIRERAKKAAKVLHCFMPLACYPWRAACPLDCIRIRTTMIDVFRDRSAQSLQGRAPPLYPDRTGI